MRYWTLGLIAVLLLSISVYTASVQNNINGELKEDEAKVSINIKQKKKATLLAIKNSGDESIYGVKIKIDNGNIKFVKARGWDSDSVDQNTMLIKTNGRPILPNRSLIILLIKDNSNSSLEWFVFDKNDRQISNGSLYLHKQFLTANTWTTKNTESVGVSNSPFAPSTYYWQFSGNGKVRWAHQVDYFESSEGFYKLVPNSDISGIILIVLETNVRIADKYTGEPVKSDILYQVLRYDIQDETVQIAGKSYFKTYEKLDPIYPRYSPSISRQVLDEANIKTTFPIWSRITEKNWIVENPDELAVRLLPQEITFRKDGTYEMLYSNGCKLSGTFSITVDAEVVNNILYFVPESNCEPRGYKEAYISAGSIALFDNKIIFNGQTYS